MKRLILLICAISSTLFIQAKDWTQYVNPLMGTQSSYELSTGNTLSCHIPALGNELLDSSNR